MLFRPRDTHSLEPIAAQPDPPPYRRPAGRFIPEIAILSCPLKNREVSVLRRRRARLEFPGTGVLSTPLKHLQGAECSS